MNVYKIGSFSITSQRWYGGHGKFAVPLRASLYFFFRHWCLRSAIMKFADGIALPPVLPYVTVRAAWSIDFNQRGSIAKASLCSNYRLSVRPSRSRSDPIHARSYTTGSPVKRATRQIQSLKCSAHARTHAFDTFERARVTIHGRKERRINDRSLFLSLSAGIARFQEPRTSNMCA